ncbi:unnamed protein product, partial [Symbiodinium sp. KB8]
MVPNLLYDWREAHLEELEEFLRAVEETGQSQVDSRPTLQWSNSSMTDIRVPLFLDEFLMLGAESYDLVFKDAETGPRLMSYGLRGLQDYLLNDFVESPRVGDDFVAPAYAPKLQDLIVSCKTVVLEALCAIDRQQAYETDELPKRKSAAELAAKKILDAKQDENRKQSVEKWVRGELDRLCKKAQEYEANAGQAATTAGSSLHKLMNIMLKEGAFAAEFSDKLEVWRQMDATQKVSLEVLAGGKVPAEPSLETQPDTLQETQPDTLQEAPPDSTEATQRDDNMDIDKMTETQRMINQSSKDWECEECEWELSDPNFREDGYDYGQEPVTFIVNNAESNMCTDADNTQSREGGRDSNKAQSGEGGHDSGKAQSGEGGHDSDKAQSGEGGRDSDKAQFGEGSRDSNNTQSGEGGRDSETKAQPGEGGRDSETKAQPGEGGHVSKPPGNSSGSVEPQGMNDDLHKLSLDATVEKNQDEASDAGSVELLNDDAFIEAELSRLILKEEPAEVTTPMSDPQAAAPVMSSAVPAPVPEMSSAVPAPVPEALPEAVSPVEKAGELDPAMKQQIQDVTTSLQRLNTADIQAISATAVATTPAAKIDPCPESADTRVVEDLEDNPATDDEDAKLEARKKAKRDRMKFNRSLESPNCPDAVLKKAADGKYGTAVLKELFKMYVDSGFNWMNSELVVQANRLHQTAISGARTYQSFKSLVEKHGEAKAKTLRAEKQAKQRISGDYMCDVPWHMSHPDFPNDEDEELFLVFESDRVENNRKDEQPAMMNSMTEPLARAGPQPGYRHQISFLVSNLEQNIDHLESTVVTGSQDESVIKPKMDQVQKAMEKYQQGMKTIKVPIHHVPVPIRTRDRQSKLWRTETRDMPLILPHELCLHLHRKNKHCASEDELHKFWSHFKSRSNPEMKWPFMWDATCIPLGLHGDDCRFTDGGQKVICVSMNYLLDEAQMRYPLFVIRYALSTGFETLEAYLKPVVASFNIVTYGISPPRFLADPDIDPATVYSINDVAPDCRFPAAAIVELRGSLVKLRGFDHNYIKWCTLHTLNLGVACWAVASALLELLKLEDVWPAPPGTASKDKTNVRLGIAYVEFTSWAKEFHVEHSQPEFCAKTLRDAFTGYAEMACKGHNARVVTAWVSHKLCTLHPLYKGGDRFEVMVTCLYWLAEYFNLLEKLPRFLSHSESLSLLHACDMSSVAYAKLATVAVECEGWQEISQMAILDGHNPRYSHTFRDESFMGAVKGW